MTKRDYIDEILSKKEGLSPASQRWNKVWGRAERLRKVLSLVDLLSLNGDLTCFLENRHAELSWDLRDLVAGRDEIQHEVARYIPIGLVACIEGYFRLAYADLINYGSPFRENATEFDIKFNLKMAVSLQNNSLSLGEFIAHLLTTNNLEDINGNMSVIMGEDFLRLFRRMRPILDTQQHLPFVNEDEITDGILASVRRLFELRHMFCHEADPWIAADAISITGGARSAIEFVVFSDAIINNLLQPKAT
jgi:hypothetical protein